MRPGRIVDGRFEIVRLAGEGGMGRVFEARDRRDERTVAVKVIHAGSATQAERFAREVAVLADLSHPGIVRYVAHGVTDESEPFLVMEWLEGETLSERLRRERLGIAASAALAARLARTLGFLHRRNVVHRDLKPSNVFLPGGSIDRPLLIDFGIAHVARPGPRLTATGAMIGTPGYMAPEQARGEAGLDGKVDVFSLGCILYKCLTGADAFSGDDALSIVLKVVLEEPPRASSLRPGIPRALDALLVRMLAKDRGARIGDADALAADLEALDPSPLSSRPLSSRRPAEIAVFLPAPGAREITTDERKLMALVLVRDAYVDPETTRVEGASRDSAETEAARRTQAMRAAAERHHGRLEILADGAILMVLTSTGTPTDLAARAARAALAIAAEPGDAPVSLVMGRAEITESLPIGNLIDRAVRLSLRASGPWAIRVDEMTAGLLGARFDVRADAPGLTLHGEHGDAEPAQMLLGKPSACVGRERELAILEAAFSHIADEQTAGAVVVTAAAGMGKSRLRHELVRRLRARGEPLEIWMGHGDPLSAGSAFGLLSRALGNALGFGEGDPQEKRRDAIRARTRSLPEPDRVAVFLGELCGAPFPDDASPMLPAARRDPVLLGDQMRHAAEDLVRATCEATPLVLLLEDLHWGDLPTVKFVDAALRNLAELPLLVLALGRPEVHTRFPRLWEERAAQLVRLPELPRRACEKLVQRALGDAAKPDVVQALVERADGNAFYLEELVRAVAGGRGADLPETVLAMAQARIEALDFEVRRLLRAASIFGATFSRAGVEALMGGASVGDRLAELCAMEVLVQRPGPGEATYGFRHALIREAAYGMLTDRDRTLGHRLAGAFLDSAGSGDAMALAEHFERGGEPERAAAFYRRAAEEALAGDDLVAALERAAKGIACGAGLEDLGALQLRQAEAHLWRGELAEAEARATEARDVLPKGSTMWFRAVMHGMSASAKRGALDRTEAWIGVALDASPAEGARSAWLMCLALCSSELLLSGSIPLAEVILAECQRFRKAGGEAIDAEATAFLYQAEAFRAMTEGDPVAASGRFAAALQAFVRAGDRRNACTTRSNLGFAFIELGELDRAVEVLPAALEDATQMGLHELFTNTMQNLGCALSYLGRVDEAREALDRATEAAQKQGNPRMEGVSRAYLARVALLAGDAGAAEHDARTAAELLRIAPPPRALALAVLARALLAQGRAPEALAVAEEAFAALEALGGTLEEGESLVRLVHAEALAAAGRAPEAARALADARERLLARAAKIRDPAVRERFLTRIPENAATLAELS